MQPTRLCRSGILLGGALLIAAWIFDEPPFFFVGGAIWLFLLFSLHCSVSAARSAASSLKGERYTNERFSRSGTRIHMTTTLTCQVTPGYHLKAEEILPDSAIDITGETQGNLSDDNGSCTLTYSFLLLAHGTIHPGGVILRCSDAFFTITVPVLTTSLQEPALFVFPRKGNSYEGAGEYGDQETIRRTPLKSSGIHSFREYCDGDSIKAIDWKMTAKHGTTYVREYTGSEGGTAAMVVDLPDEGPAVTEEVFSGIKKTVIQRIAECQERHESSMVIILAGCDVVAVRDIIPGADILHEISGMLAPQKRIHSLYRTYSPMMLAIRMRSAGKQGALTIMAERAVETFSRRGDRVGFEETMHHILVSSMDTEIHCYTTGAGDLSHIWAMASAAYGLHRPVRIFFPEGAITPSVRKEAEFFHVRSLEVIQ